ncbi:hypothetical protein ACFPIF_19690 [Brevundimonas faecalis]|uniref:hypothetical protein n=1 Tax=Brevundimonas faecalis TaxID=947378 RepID=UPI003608E7E8
MTKRKKPPKADLDRSARALLAFLERNRQERIFDYPFGYSYPQNCCESVSLILTYLLEAKYGLDNVQIIKGTNHRHEHHLWVMVGDLIYDLTAQQFVGQDPIIGVLAHSFFLDAFPDWEIERGRDFVDRARVIEAHQAGLIPF